MPKLSNKSIERLITCTQNIQDVMRVAIIHGPDFSVISGRRSTEEQAEKVRLGYSKTMYSKHVADEPNLAKAIDIAPYIREWNELIIGTPQQVKAIAEKTGHSPAAVQMRIWKQYGYLAGWVMRVAQDLNVDLVWGGDWDRDWNAIENNFEDLGHFEEVV